MAFNTENPESDTQRINNIIGDFLPESSGKGYKKELHFVEINRNNDTFLEKIKVKSNHEERLYLRDLREIPSQILEDNRTNRRIDDFISRNFPREIPPIQMPVIPSKHSFRSVAGLTAGVVGDASTISGLTVRGEHIEAIGVARIDFIPGGRTNFEPRNITDSLVRGIEGIGKLLDAIDNGDFCDADVLVGYTNINMALIAQRLGFSIVDQDRTVDGHIDKSKFTFTVVGRMEGVRAKFKEFEMTGKAKKLRMRHAGKLTVRTADIAV